MAGLSGGRPGRRNQQELSPSAQTGVTVVNGQNVTVSRPAVSTCCRSRLVLGGIWLSGSASGSCRVVGCFAALFGRVLLAAVVEAGGEGGDGFGTWFGVAGEGAEVTVAALAWSSIADAPGFAEVGEGGVAELVEGQPAAGFPQGCACSFVGEAPSGRYDFTNPTPPPHGQLRPLRTPLKP